MPGCGEMSTIWLQGSVAEQATVKTTERLMGESKFVREPGSRNVDWCNRATDTNREPFLASRPSRTGGAYGGRYGIPVQSSCVWGESVEIGHRGRFGKCFGNLSWKALGSAARLAEVTDGAREGFHRRRRTIGSRSCSRVDRRHGTDSPRPEVLEGAGRSQQMINSW